MSNDTASVERNIASPTVETPARRRGVKPRKIIEFPEPLFEIEEDPEDFRDALVLQMRRFGDTGWHLHRAVVRPDEQIDRKTFFTWIRGDRCPRTADSMAVLGRIERRYHLPDGYFKAKLPYPARSVTGHHIPGIGDAERRRLAWHLPDDFDERPAPEQETILEWVRTVIISEMVMPGDNVSMDVELIAMDDGPRFAIREGGRTVGADGMVSA